MNSIKEILTGKTILFDGAMGTTIQRMNLEHSDPPELLNLFHPKELESIHRSYIEAGAQIIETNTFGGNRKRLEQNGLEDKVAEINTAAVKIAKAAAGGKAFVAGSVGPLGVLIEPYGDLPAEAAKNIFAEQIKFLLEAGADLILIETMISLDEALLALEAAKEAGSKITGVTLTFENGAQGVRTPYGETPAQSAKTLAEHGADFVGSNCGHGAGDILLVAREMKSATDVPLLIQPNAGLPRFEAGKIIYDESPENFGLFAKSAIELGAEMIGGCCGTTFEHIRTAAGKL